MYFQHTIDKSLINCIKMKYLRKTYYIKFVIFSGFLTILISQLTFHCFMLLKRQVLIASPVLASIRIRRL